MNATVYLFGEFNSGYTQYPDDYTSGIFRKFHKEAKSTTQVAIHRDGNLMYYGYLRQLEQERYIGLCVVLNNLLLTRIDGLFSLFENTISGLVTNGRLIHFNEQGDIVTNVESLYMNKEEIDLLDESLRAGFSRFENSMVTLPAVCYGTSKESVKEFVVDANIVDIIGSSHTNGYTFIYKSRGYNTVQMNSYKGVLVRINNEKNNLQKELNKLQTEHTRILRQKKQFKFIIVLFTVLFGCAIVLLNLNDSLNATRHALTSANDTISKKNASLNEQSVCISDLNNMNVELEQKRQAEETRRIEAETRVSEAEDNLENLEKIILQRQPFIIRKTNFNFSTGYLHFDYYGFTDETVTIAVRAFNENGIVATDGSSIHVKQGDNSASVFLGRGLNSVKWYSFEILKGNVIIGGERH